MKNELELITAKEKAKESDQLKTDFINNISNEVRTPLSGFTGPSLWCFFYSSLSVSGIIIICIHNVLLYNLLRICYLLINLGNC
jgi:signal transduction histidine kinase